MMRNVNLQAYNCPLFLFDPEMRRGQLLNPATGLVELEFPGQDSRDEGYPLHEASPLSTGFARYLHYLVNEHILFNHQSCEELACVEEAECDAESVLEFSSVWFRTPLQFTGLSGLYDRLGFCFLDGALYTPMYCEVLEMRLRN